jgi:copper transport protein
VRRLPLLLLVATAALVVLAGPALAHATLVEAVPADRSAVDVSPEVVRLTFSEPVDAGTGALRVFDATAERIDLGPIDPGDPAAVAVALSPGLPDGGYVATYRVTSADSHVVAGVVTFTVGDGEEVADEVVAELFGGAGRGWPGVVGPVLRGLGYAATLLAGGAVAVAAVVARRPDQRRSARRLARPAAVAGIAATLLAVPVQAAAVGGSGVVDAFAPTLLGEVLSSPFGWGTLARLAGLVGLLALWRPAADRAPRALAPPGTAAAVAVGSYLLDGHQRSMEPTGVLLAADAVHLAAGAVWFAGLVLLATWLRRRAADPDDPSALVDPVGDAQVVARFSGVALVAVLAVAASGLAMAAVLVRGPGALTTTTYGWTLLLKLTAVVMVVAVAAYNRRRLVPAVAAAGGDGDPQPARRRLTTTVRAEALVLVGVLLVTGTLVSRPPAALDAGLTGSYRSAAPLTDDLTVDLVVDPNRAGRNTLHLYVVEPTGRPTDRVEELRLELTYLPEAIGPIPLELYPVGPGHWTGIVDDLAFPGAWELRVVAAVGAFDEAAATLTVPVAP